MKVAIIQSNYLPWKGYFDIIQDVDVFCFYDEVKYTKNDWRNRNKIYTKNGLQWLTIPISKDAVKLKIGEVNIEDPSWQLLHHKILQLAYKNAPYFKQLEYFLDEFYIKNQWSSLSELNQHTTKSISKFLKINTEFVNSKDYDLRGDRVNRLINLLTDLNATEYISGPSAKSYLEGCEELFQKNNIKLTFKSYGNYLPYQQLNNPFEHFVSIVDLIANVSESEIEKYIKASS